MKKIYAINGSPRLNKNDAYQFNDYSKYVCETFSGEEKAEYRNKHFPEICDKAFNLGKHLLD